MTSFLFPSRLHAFWIAALIFAASRAASPAAAAAACRGDCDGGGAVTVDELVRGVNIALGSITVDACLAFDADVSGTVTVDELVAAVNNAFSGCVPAGDPTHTPTRAATPSPTPTAPLSIVWINRGPDIDYQFGLPTGFDALTLDADHTLYAGIADPVFDIYGVYVSPDGGQSWEPSSTETGIYALDVDRPTGNVYAVGDSRKVLSTMDGGGMWTEIGMLPESSSSVSDVTNLIVNPGQPQRLYSFGKGKFGSAGANLSTDGGATWTTAAPIVECPGCTVKSEYSILALAPSDPEILYGAGYDGGARKAKLGSSDDAGDTWTPINASGLGQNEITAMAIDPTMPQTVYAGTNTTVFKSTNGGVNWLPMPTGLPQEIEVLQIVVDPTAPQTLYLATLCTGTVVPGESCVFRSADGGSHWEPMTDGLDVSCPSNPTRRCHARVNEILLDPQSQNLYAATHFGVYSALLR